MIQKQSHSRRARGEVSKVFPLHFSIRKSLVISEKAVLGEWKKVEARMQ